MELVTDWYKLHLKPKLELAFLPEVFEAMRELLSDKYSNCTEEN